MGYFRGRLSQTTSTLKWFIVVLLVIGIIFRFLNLGYKVYWHDEVYTTIRAAGFTQQEIDRTLFQNHTVSVTDLQQFQQIKPNSTVTDTLLSLATEEPQHPPLYFLMTRYWMQWFGSSITASRMLPALLSLLSLPLMYGLGLELFAFPLAALLATTLLALSPFDILFAQTARQYSLLTVITLGSSWLLLRSLRRASWPDWGCYILSNVIGLYTHPLFGLTLIAHGVYVGLRNLVAPSQYRLGSAARKQLKSPGLAYVGAIALTLLLYSPWLLVLSRNLNRTPATSNWVETSASLVYLVQLWILNFTSPFLDLNFGLNHPLTLLLRLPVLLIILAALYTVCHHTPRTSWLFILTLLLVPFLLLALPDIALAGQRSTVSRYLVACYPAIQLAVGYWLALRLKEGRLFWRGVAVLLISGSILSCGLSAFSETWWNKESSYFNAATARLINSAPAPLVVSDRGDDLTNTGDLLSLSYRLKDTVKLSLFSSSPNLTILDRQSATNWFAFRPSTALRQALLQNQWQTGDPLLSGERLWQLRR